MSQPQNAAPAPSAEEILLQICKDDQSESGLKTVKDFDPKKHIYPDVCPQEAVPAHPYIAYKRVQTRGKKRIGALSNGGPEWVNIEYLCVCSEGEAKRGVSRSLANAVINAIEAVTYPATILGRAVASIKARENRQDLVAASPEGEALPDRVVRLEISVKLN